MFGWLWVETRMFRTRRLNHVPHYIMAILVSQDKIFHNMEFKMERQGLLTVGQEVDVTESVLPTSYYYTIQPMIAMSKNYPGYERLQSRKGIVKDIKETDRGYYTVVEFDEEDIGS